MLTVEEEAVIVAFRRYTLLPLGDCLYALQPTISHLRPRHCTAACNVTASAAWTMSKATGRREEVQGLSDRLLSIRRPAPNWDSVGLEQFVSTKGSKTRTSGEVLDDFGTFFRAHDAMKG